MDVSYMSQTTADHVEQCLRMDPEQLQRLTHPKTLNAKQEE